MSSFDHIKEVLAKWPNDIPQTEFPVACHERLRLALQMKHVSPANVGAGDLTGLIRHVLARESAISEQCETQVRVPKSFGWPTEAQWRASGLAVDVNPQSFRISYRNRWTPDWLPDADLFDPLIAAFREDRRRCKQQAPRLEIDPCLHGILGQHFSHYSSPGQEQAIHAAFLAPSGSTLVINLPTGTGKSLVMQVPVLMKATERGGTTLVIVPTIALGIDQERQLRELAKASPNKHLASSFDHPLAYHSGLTEIEKKDLRLRILNGTQHVVFAAPESAMRSLAFSLYEAAKSGRLNGFIVDEAHLIADWGSDFRSEFQAIGGLRNELLRLSPPKSRFITLLMTATLTQDTLDTLQTLFGIEGSQFDVIAATHLRPEPEYWVKRASFESDQSKWILDCVRHVPRPFLLYVTRPDVAEFWLQRLRGQDLKRVECFHGGTKPTERERILDAWKAKRIDAVVATSAFGLGVDNRDVRAVIHACVPETLDRFYQEVGRGGRDGNACVSLMVYTPQDLETARGMSQDKLVTVEKGLPRWDAMFSEAWKHRDNSQRYLRVNLGSLATHVNDDSPSNRAWNLRTLVMLARAGVIRIGSSPPPKWDGDSDETSQSTQSAETDSYFKSCYVEVLETNRHRDKDFWNSQIEAHRRERLSAAFDSFDVIEDMLNGRREMSSLLCDLYCLETRGFRLQPVRACGGCAVCRTQIPVGTNYATPHPFWPCGVQDFVSPEVQARITGGQNFVLVAYRRPGPARPDYRKWVRVLFDGILRPLVRSGVREISAPASIRDDRQYADLARYAPERFLIHRTLDDADQYHCQLRVPRISVLDPEWNNVLPEHLFHIERPLHVVLAPDDIPDASANGLLFDRAMFISFEELIERLRS